jgi:hypothetical protein
MNNERLRTAMVKARISIADVNRSTGVDEKTVQRWIAGRTPHQRHRWAVAALLDEDEAYLWPRSALELGAGAASTAEVVAAYAHRAEVPHTLWTGLVDGSRRRVHVLAYAALFLAENYPGLASRLAEKAADGCDVRLALVDADSDAARNRDAEEGLDGALLARIRNAEKLLAPLVEVDGAQVRRHATAMYNSVFVFDDEMLVTPHLYRRSGFESPTLHLRRLGEGGIFDTFLQHVDEVWTESVRV